MGYKANFLSILISFLLFSCSYYNFTGTGKIEAETFQVKYFQNTAGLVEQGIDRKFTLALQDLIQNQTALNLTDTNGDLVYEGEIVDYTISPMTATSNQQAAQNRLYVAVNVRFFNKKDHKSDFEKRFSHYYDYPANESLRGNKLEAAINEIYERILQDIFNESLAKW